MNRSLVPVLATVGVLVLFLGTFGFLLSRTSEPEQEIELVEPLVADIVLKTVATGAIVPRVEVAIKSRVSGVMRTLQVEPGDQVEAGTLLATIQIIPDSASLNNAQANVRTARIELDAAKQEMERAESLSAKSALSASELLQVTRDFELAKQGYTAALQNLQIVKEGATRGSGNVSTEVRSTVAGMVLSVDVEEGQSVTETNTFSEGTTVASVADMTDMVFEGTLDESEVGRIREGMPLEITVGALQERVIAGTLEYISPKGVLVDGAVQFEIRAAITAEANLFIRAGSSATADIVLDKRSQVLTIDEKALRFDGSRALVDVQTSPGEFESRPVEVGLSDGIKIEVLSGVDASDRLRAGT